MNVTAYVSLPCITLNDDVFTCLPSEPKEMASCGRGDGIEIRKWPFIMAAMVARIKHLERLLEDTRLEMREMNDLAYM